MKCDACGRHPLPGMVETHLPVQAKSGSRVMPTAKSRDLRKQPRRGLGIVMKLLVGWLVLTGLILLLMKWLYSDELSPDGRTEVVPVAATSTAQDEALLGALPDCRRALEGFLAARDADSRMRWILNAPGLRERVNQPDAVGAVSLIQSEELSLTGKTLIRLPEGPCVVTQWKSAAGDRFDAAFRQENGAWKLDWNHFLRSGTQSWALFVAGSGPDTAEFRVFARERSLEGESEKPFIGLMLYAPRIEQMSEAGHKAVIEPLPRNGFNGRVLEAAFAKAREGKGMFGAAFPDENPPEMIRVRVVVQRISGDGRIKFEIRDVKACHWYDSDALGVEPQAGEPEDG